MKPENVNPKGYWVMLKAEKRKTTLESGLILTQKETYSEDIGFHSAKIMKLGDKVLDFININRDVKLTKEDILSKRLIIRYYMKDVIRFKESSLEEPVYLVNMADPSITILGLIDDEVIDML